MPRATPRASPRATPRGSVVESSTVSSSVTVQPPPRDHPRSFGGSERPKSASQLSISQTSGPSRPSSRIARTPRHPDLIRSSQIPLLDATSSLIDLGDPNPMGVNRLSTIPDVTDGEESSLDISEQPERHAEDDPNWFENLQKAGSDWEFLRLVEENRKQRPGNENGTFIPPPRSSISDNELQEF